MWENLIKADKELLIYLNSLGSETWDSLWLGITNQFNWTPLFLVIFYLTFKTFGWKKGLFTILFMIVLVAFSDQFTNFVKDYFMRLRPNNDPTIKEQLRILYSPRGKSFYSGHAATSSAFISFTIFIFRNRIKYIYFLIFFPLIFAYSRLYLGVHFPIDIIVGLIAGTSIGYLFSKLYHPITIKFFKNK